MKKYYLIMLSFLSFHLDYIEGFSVINKTDLAVRIAVSDEPPVSIEPEARIVFDYPDGSIIELAWLIDVEGERRSMRINVCKQSDLAITYNKVANRVEITLVDDIDNPAKISRATLFTCSYIGFWALLFYLLRPSMCEMS